MSILLSLQAVGAQTAEQMPDLTAVTAPTEAEINVIDLAFKGGWIMVVLLLLSLMACYIFIQRMMVIRRAGKEDETFMNRIKDYIHEGKVDSALNLCRSTNTPSARMIEKGITRLGRPMNDVLVAIENVGNLEIAKLEKKISSMVRQSIDKNQKEYFLREQMKVIRNELGDGVSAEEYQEKYKEQLEQLSCSEEVYQKIAEEIKRLDAIPTSSSEHIVERTYIENLLALPWDKASIDRNDIVHAEQILEEDHYGLKKVKERILESLAVRCLTDKSESPILCLVGPPGTGKTSIARSVARALDKEYVRICLGGVRDEAEIRGHRRTYVGALPGRFVEGLKKAKVRNPLMLLDEIDKVGSDYKGDCASALLEILDPEQNRNFVDHYIELPVDLSDVLFICTANTTETIPRPLLDRMELISIAGYTENERFHIGKDYLIPKQLEKNGLQKKNLQILDGGLRAIISHYTKEAGVRELERQIGKVCRKCAKKIMEGETETIRVTSKNITDFLGKKRFRVEKVRLVLFAGLPGRKLVAIHWKSK